MHTDSNGHPERSGAGSSLAKYAGHWQLPDAEFRYAETRDRKRFRHYDTEQELVARWLRLCEPGATVLDLPCGTGRFSELIASCGHRLIRADLSYQMVAHARRLGPNGHVLGDLCCDLAAPPINPAGVDIVLVWRLFHHCRTPEDRDIVLRQARRLARRYVILSFYNRASLTYWSRRFVRKVLCREPKCRGAIRTSELLAAADRAGLEPVEIHHYRPGLSINSAVCFRVC
ncbi:MAG TPA: class I SAM-dependent methyltransferase [Phycisphaerae bacterium]|nr:class I SAM-dependent methyltransferase [Phycisphaerae bacterium]